ncbi:MAG: hypothetical protein VX278_03670 [Myxococcota bacterium]|nr:hypothetical protein [Myxococcota bacterium]
MNDPKRYVQIAQEWRDIGLLMEEEYQRVLERIHQREAKTTEKDSLVPMPLPVDAPEKGEPHSPSEEEVHKQLQQFVSKNSRRSLENRRRELQTQLETFLEHHPDKAMLQERGTRLVRLLSRFPQEPLHEWSTRLQAGADQIDQFIQRYSPPSSAAKPPQKTDHPSFASDSDTPSSPIPAPSDNRSFVKWLLLLSSVFIVLFGAVWSYSNSRVPPLGGIWISPPVRAENSFFVYVLEIEQEDDNLQGQIRTHPCNPYMDHTPLHSKMSGTIHSQSSSTRTVKIDFKNREKALIQPVEMRGIFEFDTKLSKDGFFSATRFHFDATPPFATKHQNQSEWSTVLERADDRPTLTWCSTL